VALDPERGGMAAVAEAARNLSCVGAEPLAVTDNLNFPSPETPTGYWQLAMACRGLAEACQALATPVTGGNVSLYNESRLPDGSLQPIHPTPVVGMVGLVGDLARVTGLAWRQDGDAIWLLGVSPEAADAPALAPEALFGLPDLRLRPAVRLLRLRTNVHDVRAAVLTGAAPPPTEAADVWLVVFRRGVSMRTLALEPGAWTLLDALDRGLVLGLAAIILAASQLVAWGLPRPVLERLAPRYPALATAFKGLGKEFMPTLNEGSLLFMPVLLPATSLTEVKRIMAWQDRVIAAVPEVASVGGKLGRGGDSEGIVQCRSDHSDCAVVRGGLGDGTRDHRGEPGTPTERHSRRPREGENLDAINPGERVVQGCGRGDGERVIR
jgi:hypothetical protein